MTDQQFKGIAIVGPTASGKTSLALGLAQHLDVEIVCCDSVQVYRRFNIGSAKPTTSDQELVPHHMLDIVNWDDPFDAAMYAQQARTVIDGIYARQRIPLLVGGTGLYLRALQGQQWHADLPKDEELRKTLQEQTHEELYAQISHVDPLRAKEIHPRDKFRLVRALEIYQLTGKSMRDIPKTVNVESEFFTIFLSPERSTLHKRIAERTHDMLQSGFISEVEELLATGVDPQCKPMQSIGYKQVAEFLVGKTLPHDELAMKIIVATRQYAKRQCTWFKKSPNQLVTENYEVDAILHLLRDAGVYATSS